MSSASSRVHAVLTSCLAVALAATAAHAQPGTGAPFGARDARRCTVRTPRGQPTAAQAAHAFACQKEYVDGAVGETLWLVGP